MFFSPYMTYISILLMAASIPVLGLMYYIYTQDKVEHEPIKEIVRVMFFGALSGAAAIILETILMPLMGVLFDPYSYGYIIALNFIGIAFSEELVKLIALSIGCWRLKYFDYHFDGIVYAVASSLGFALLENVIYVFRGGLSVAVIRSILSVPGHLCFSIPMGVFFANAKSYSLRRQTTMQYINLFLALFVPICLHGLFDGLITVNDIGAFATYVVALYMMSFMTIRRQHMRDHHL
ncbi:MAG: PrsW family intramembrane metalloprotease [Erysipelotrichaceae bacterium]|nr:PrsW family intramembrane metalloprotease [Erysipelotrichaceae bacterium]